MAFKITNLTEVITALQLTDREVNDQARAVLREAAVKIRDTARQYAPVDEHRLEKAIQILPSQGNQYTLRVTIAVTGAVDGRIVDTYAAIVHEYPWTKRGPLTKVKGPKAGPRYLARAMRDNEKWVIKKLSEAMGRGINRAISRSGVNNKRRRR
jgi:hypothetical protein